MKENHIRRQLISDFNQFAREQSILDVRTHYKPSETFQYTNYNSCHPAGVKKGFVKGEALRLLRTNCSKVMFEENIKNFTTRLTSRGYPNNLVDKILSEVKFAENSTLCDTISSITAIFEKYSNGKMAFNTNQPLLREMYKEPPLIFYRKRKSLKDMLVKVKL